MSDFIKAWVTLFGIYTPLSFTDQAGNVSYMTDWGYIARCVFFIIVVVCVFKMLGGMFKHDRR